MDSQQKEQAWEKKIDIAGDILLPYLPNDSLFSLFSLVLTLSDSNIVSHILEEYFLYSINLDGTRLKPQSFWLVRMSPALDYFLKPSFSNSPPLNPMTFAFAPHVAFCRSSCAHFSRRHILNLRIHLRHRWKTNSNRSRLPSWPSTPPETWKSTSLGWQFTISGWEVASSPAVTRFSSSESWAPSRTLVSGGWAKILIERFYFL